MIDSPYETLEAWVLFFESAEIPVLRHTTQALANLREHAETTNGRVLSSVILHDPLMTLRVLHYIEKNRSRRQTTDITTIERALMMIGIDPFFKEFEQLPVLEEQLKNHPKALLGALKALNRARHAAHWARDWAIFRHDLDVDEITVAALLRYVSDILMWSFAPALALEVRELQSSDKHLRSSVAQESVYNIKLDDLHLALAKAWKLPELLVTLMDRKQAENPRVKNVTLACDLARHSANGWDDAALPDDYKGIEDFLHIDHPTLMQRLGLDENGHPRKSA